MTVWAAIVAVLGTVGMIVSGVFAAGATKRAAAATAEATRAAAVAQAEPNQRAQDLAAFKEVRDDLRKEVQEFRAETTRLRAIVRSFAWYVSELTGQMRTAGVEPVPPPALVEEYNRTGG